MTELMVKAPGGDCEAWLARPENGAEAPGVLLFMDAIGLRPQIYEMADRIASGATWSWRPTRSIAPTLLRRRCRAPRGGLVTDEADSPHRSLATARAGILLRHADQDGSMSPEGMQVISESAAAAGVELDQDVYSGAPHGHSMADTSMYDASAAERHFEEMRAHFASLDG